MNLFEEGQARFRRRPRPDWKKEIEELYIKWRACDDEIARDEIETELVRAYAPFLAYVSYRYRRADLDFSWEDAFNVGLLRFSYSLHRFDPDKSPRGTRALSSYMMTTSMNDMLKEIQNRELRKHSGVSMVSLDAALEDPSYGFEKNLASYDDTESAGLTPVKDVVVRAMNGMRDVDAFIVETYVLGGMSWSAVRQEAVSRGFRRPQAFWSTRYRERIAPALRDALRSAGYDGE